MAKKYLVLLDNSARGLANKVEKWIDNPGIELQGGVSITIDSDGGLLYAQALTYEEYYRKN